MFDPPLPSAQGNETYADQTYTAYVGLYNAERDNLDLNTGAGPLEGQTAQGRGRVPMPVPALPITAVLALMGLMAHVCRRSLQKAHRAT